MGLLAADRSGCAFAVDDARPTIVEAMAAGGIAMAGALRFATGAPSGGEAAWQERPFQGDRQQFHGVGVFCFHLDVAIH